MRNSKAPSHPASFIESHVSRKDKQTHFSRLIFTVEYIKAQQCDSKKNQTNKKKQQTSGTFSQRLSKDPCISQWTQTWQRHVDPSHIPLFYRVRLNKIIAVKTKSSTGVRGNCSDLFQEAKRHFPARKKMSLSAGC